MADITQSATQNNSNGIGVQNSAPSSPIVNTNTTPQDSLVATSNANKPIQQTAQTEVSKYKPATNLYEYYTQQGQQLPTVEQRTPLANANGINNYSGTEDQNNLLLSKLQRQGQTQSTQQPQTQSTQQPQQINTTPSPSPTQQPQQTQQVDNTVRDNTISNLFSSGALNVNTADLNNPTNLRNTLSGVGINVGDLSDQQVQEKVQSLFNNPFFRASNEINQQFTSQQQQYGQLQSNLTSLKTQVDNAFSAQIDATIQSFNLQIQKTQTVYDSTIQARQSALTAMGGFRYAPTISPGFISRDQVNMSLDIATIENQKAQAVATLLQAQANADTALFDKSLQTYNSLNDKQTNTLNQLLQSSEKTNATYQTSLNKQIATDYATAIANDILHANPKDPFNTDVINKAIAKYKSQIPSLSNIDPELLKSSIATQVSSLNKLALESGLSYKTSAPLIRAIQNGTITPEFAKSNLPIASLLANNGINVNKLQNTNDIYKSSLQTQVDNNQKLRSQITQAESFTDQLLNITFQLENKNLLKKLPPIFNSYYIDVAGKTFPQDNPLYTQYANALNNARSSYATLIAGNGNVTDEVRNQATKIIPAGLTATSLNSFIEGQLKSEVSTRIQGQNSSQNAIERFRIENNLSPINNPAVDYNHKADTTKPITQSTQEILKSGYSFFNGN